MCDPCRSHTVSVLDLEQNRLAGRTSRLCLTRRAVYSDVCISLYDVKYGDFPKKGTFRPVGRQSHRNGLTVKLERLVGRGGLEPPTSRLSGVRSNHLSYRPNLVERVALQARRSKDRSAPILVERIGIEPMTPCLQSRCSPS